MSERLERIANTGGMRINEAGYLETDLSLEDMEWLIQQAERVEELKEQNKSLFEEKVQLASKKLEYISVLQNKNKRYRQALEEILKQHENEEEIDDYDFMWNVSQLARQALDGDSQC